MSGLFFLCMFFLSQTEMILLFCKWDFCLASYKMKISIPVFIASFQFYSRFIDIKYTVAE